MKVLDISPILTEPAASTKIGMSFLSGLEIAEIGLPAQVWNEIYKYL